MTTTLLVMSAAAALVCPRYKPTMTRDEYLEARAAAEVGALVDTYGEAALVHFARHMDQLDPEHRRQMRRLAHRG